MLYVSVRVYARIRFVTSHTLGGYNPFLDIIFIYYLSFLDINSIYFFIFIIILSSSGLYNKKCQ